MVENCRSSGVATDEAIVSGLAPGQARRHLDASGSRRSAGRSPAARGSRRCRRAGSPAMTSVVMTGRRMKISERFTASASSACAPASARRRGRRAALPTGVALISTCAPGREPELAVGDHPLAGCEALARSTASAAVRATSTGRDSTVLVGLDHEDVRRPAARSAPPPPAPPPRSRSTPSVSTTSTNWPGQSARSSFANVGLEQDGAGRGVDRVVDEGQPRRDRARPRSLRHRPHLSGPPRGAARCDRGQVLLGHA